MLALGIDIGTSGVRTAVIDRGGALVSSARVAMPPPAVIAGRSQQDPAVWWDAVDACLSAQAAALRQAGHAADAVTAIAVDGTSGTILLADADLRSVGPALMYDCAGLALEAAVIDRHAPAGTIARGPGSTVARLMALQVGEGARRARFALHQADWIAARLTGCGGVSDENNALKLGWDLDAAAWPDWLDACGIDRRLLPAVRRPGDNIAPLADDLTRRFGFARGARVVAGTTDSIAAFLAAGADRVGDGVTSLGTTLVIKLLSERRIDDPARGIYSHRLRGLWLAGGASNSGGGALLAHFDAAELPVLSARIDPDRPTGLDYYPLARPGERFPIADPDMAPHVTPRPADDAVFLQGLLEGIAAVEARGYAALAALGGPPLRRVLTAGGGAANPAWTRIRARRLAVPVEAARHVDAAVGAARLAAGLVPG
ncbi:Xylulose kinase [Rhodoplanes serenus]|uniref:Xylulose kinase n=1 Tax=Rhodoplanes serenus TaxID=200615 RepID=A0A447CXG2_9BRAD|nr:FGGY-family carbohydrate kinase [Rhodoplanes serenus]VCU09977.1 Xylulose kinase [Rhodoplanes serenus]